MSANVLVQRDGALVTVVLNRPEKLNAMTKAMWQRLGEVMATLSADDAVRCVVLRGAGGRAFSPGNDIGEFEGERHDVASARAYGQVMAGTLEAVRECRHPVVALIQGICVGGGLEIAALADIRVCGRSSRFGAPINKLGLVMSYAELGGLLRLVGRARTLELLLEGRIVDAGEAHAMGLVQRVVDDGQVVDEAYATARRVAAAAPLVARWHKTFVNRLEDPRPLSEEEREECFRCFDSADFREGYRAFLEKRTPRFGGA
jgi:enoyl-CoA hydratase/carnithine racemase